MVEDLTGIRFGKLLVVKKTNKKSRYGILWECLCDCGIVKPILASNLKRKLSQSCGCLQKEKATTHGHSHLPEYHIWNGIINRCYSNKNSNYLNYGSEGITTSDEWKNSFETFYKDMGPRPSLDHSIDRRDNNKGYSKDNCRWATRKEQQNNLSNNVFYTHRGETKNLSDWCSELGFNYYTTYSRIRRGWTFEEVIQNIQDKLFTFNLCSDEKPPETMSLKDWCDLLRLDRDVTYLRILRGESFETIVRE